MPGEGGPTWLYLPRGDSFVLIEPYVIDGERLATSKGEAARQVLDSELEAVEEEGPVSNHSSRHDRPMTVADEIRRSWNRTFLGSLGFGVLLLGLFLVGLLFVAIGLAFYLTAGWTIAVARILRGSSEFVWPVAAALTLAIVALIASLRQPRQDTQPGHQERFATLSRVCLGLAVITSLLAGLDLVQNLAGAWEVSLIYLPGGASRKSQSKNNMKQIGLAFHHYREAHGVFPAGATLNDQGVPQHSWVTSILPFLDQNPLYEQIDQKKAWSDPANLPAMRHILHSLRHPGLEPKLHPAIQVGEKPAVSHYAANQYIFGTQPGLRIPDFPDGLTNTIFAGEVRSHFVPWGKPGNWRDPRLGINQSPFGFGSASDGGAHLLMRDGTVRFVSEKISPDVLRQLGEPADGETPPVDY